MKKLFTVLSVLLLTTMNWAQSPQKMSYQAVIRDLSNNLIKEQPVGIKISILQGSVSGTVVYTETQSPTTNSNGLVSIEIGGGAGFSTINWTNGPYFIKTETDPTGGTSYSITGVSQLLSVTYALHAKTAESITETDPVFTAWDKDYTDLTNKPDLNLLMAKIEALEESDFLYNGFTDFRDGIHYKVVKIGNQIWMAENLKATKYQNGDEISNVTDDIPWNKLTTDAWCNYMNDGAYGLRYGKLYNWYAVSDVRHIAPEGWHVATDAEWTELENYLITNGYNYNGTTTGNNIAKSLASTTDWSTYSITGAIGNDLTKNNSSGFNAFPGGNRISNGTFSYVTSSSYWWSSTETKTGDALGRMLYGDGQSLNSGIFAKSYGFSVRCVKN